MTSVLETCSQGEVCGGKMTNMVAIPWKALVLSHRCDTLM